MQTLTPARSGGSSCKERAVSAEVMFATEDRHDNEAQQDPEDGENSSHDRLWSFVAIPRAERNRY